MVHSHEPDRRPSCVTVEYKESAHQFLLSGGATLTELAAYIDVLGAQHDSAPISIAVEFGRVGVRPKRRLISH